MARESEKGTCINSHRRFKAHGVWGPRAASGRNEFKHVPTPLREEPGVVLQVWLDPGAERRRRGSISFSLVSVPRVAPLVTPPSLGAPSCTVLPTPPPAEPSQPRESFPFLPGFSAQAPVILLSVQSWSCACPGASHDSPLMGSVQLMCPLLEAGGGLSPPRTLWAERGRGGVSRENRCREQTQKKGSRCLHASLIQRD